MTDDWRGKTCTIWMYGYSIAWKGEVDIDVVAFDHAVVEEEAESGSSYGGVVDFLGAYDLPHDGFEQRACFVVVSGAELGLCVGKK